MTSIVDKLMTAPKKDKGQEMPHTPHHYPKDYKHQIDLLYLPNDNKKKYALVVVDVGTRLCDAEPMQDRKPKDTVIAIEKIYKRGILNTPSMLYFDAGTEFQGEFLKYLKQSDILYRVSKTGRHRQTSLVENKNKYIARAIFRRQLEEEMLTGEVSRQWTDQLKEIIQQINKKIKPFKKKVFSNKLVKTAKTKKLLDTIEEVQQEKALSANEEREMEINGFLKRTNIPSNLPLRWNPVTDQLDEVPMMAAAGAGRSRRKKLEKNNDETYCVGDSCILLSVGTKVRRQLDVPVDYLNEKRLIGTFRATDIRWTKKPHTISDVVIKPGSPPLYILDDDTSTAYTKNQLQVVDRGEKQPDEKVIAMAGKKKGVETFYVHDIIDHKTVKKKKFYKVIWKGFAEPTWQLATMLKADVPKIVRDYEQSLKDAS
jgi:hypothetical protein